VRRGGGAAGAFAARDELRTIGVAFDDSDESQRALDGAIRLASRLEARVDVAGVVRWLAAATSDAGVVAGDLGDRDRYLDELRQACDRAIQKVPDALRGVAHTEVGDPATALAKFSENIDLLVCGSHRRGRLHQVVLGSVSTELVDKARCSLLVLPRGGRRVEDDDPMPGARAAETQEHT
jgi:nucleotide-binding universal stress UspA family protein